MDNESPFKFKPVPQPIHNTLCTMSDHNKPLYLVRLYTYDLSNGLAKSMSVAWAGKYFEAIWHTSIVYGDQLEVFFGQGA